MLKRFYEGVGVVWSFRGQIHVRDNMIKSYKNQVEDNTTNQATEAYLKGYRQRR